MIAWCCQFYPHCAHVPRVRARRIRTVDLPESIPLATLERVRDGLARLSARHANPPLTDRPNGDHGE